MKMTTASKSNEVQIWGVVSKSVLLQKMIHKFRYEVWRQTKLKYKYWRENRDLPSAAQFEKLLKFHKQRLAKHFGYILDEHTCEKVLLHSPGVIVRENIPITYRPCYFLKNEHEPEMIKIAVSPFAKASEIRAFMTKVSGRIKDRQKSILIDHFSGQSIFSRTKHNTQRDEQIVDLWNCTIEELQVLADGSPSRRKDVLISSAMMMVGDNISPDHIRKIVANQQKLVNVILAKKK